MHVTRDSILEAGAPSATALRVAALRALHQNLDVPPVFVDPLAERILGPGAPALLDTYRASAHETALLRATLAARGVVATTTVAEAFERGVRQVVILGAGLDTFAYRHPYAGLRVFEVDRAEAQAWKRAALRRADIEPPARPTFVAADFERDDVLAALAANGFDPSRPAVFVMLGVSFYILEATLLALLGRIGDGTRGTEIVFDYSEPLDRASDAARDRYRKAATRVAAGGEPWITFFEPAEIHAALRDRGFAEVLDLDAATLNGRCFAGRADGLAVVPLAHLVRARTSVSASSSPA